MVANVIGDIALVLVVSSLLGALARRCGQPTVMGPMPVLAAIVRERGLAGTTAGEIATAVAATMDALAWLVLAGALIGTGQSGRFSWPVTLLLTVCFTAVMLLVVVTSRDNG